MPLDPRRIPNAAQSALAKQRAVEQRLARVERGAISSAYAAHASTHATDGSDPLTPGMIGSYTKAEVDQLIANIPTPQATSRAYGFFMGGS